MGSKFGFSLGIDLGIATKRLVLTPKEHTDQPIDAQYASGVRVKATTDETDEKEDADRIDPQTLY